MTNTTGLQIDISRRAARSLLRRDPAVYADPANHADRLVGIRAYRLGCRCPNCKTVMRAERLRYKPHRKPSSEETTPEQARRHKLKFHYGLTSEQFDEMEKSQGGLCAICRKPSNGKRLHVDHDHSTGHVRGLLCSTCNVWLGRIDDDPAKVLLALGYLRQYSRPCEPVTP